MPQGRVRGSRQGLIPSQGCKREQRDPGKGYPAGVTIDVAENAPRLRVTFGEYSKESKPPLKRRVETPTAIAQDSSPPVPWRWRSRAASIRGSHRPTQCK